MNQTKESKYCTVKFETTSCCYGFFLRKYFVKSNLCASHACVVLFNSVKLSGGQSTKVQLFRLQKVVYSLEKLFDCDSFRSLPRTDWKSTQIRNCSPCEGLSWLLSCPVHCSSKILFWFPLGILFLCKRCVLCQFPQPCSNLSLVCIVGQAKMGWQHLPCFISNNNFP